MQLSPHFKMEEFACPCGCGFSAPYAGLLAALEWLRARIDRPIVILSGCRCEKHNREVGGASNSQHVHGMAADIRVAGMTPWELYRIASKPASVFRGFGVDAERNMLHVDVRRIPAKWCYHNGQQVAFHEPTQVHNA